MERYLQHHGIKGQKWGVRRFQNPDGSLTSAGLKRLGKYVNKFEKKAVKANKNKGYDRYSTGKNYDAVQKKYSDRWNNDEGRIALSKKAFDAEKRRLMAEKKYIEDDEKYNKYLNSKEARDLDEASQKAKEAKDAYETKIGEKWMKEYNDEIRMAKLKDIGMDDYIKDGKNLISVRSGGYMDWDGNLEWNPDNYYDDWVDNDKFKRSIH